MQYCCYTSLDGNIALSRQHFIFGIIESHCIKDEHELHDKPKFRFGAHKARLCTHMFTEKISKLLDVALKMKSNENLWHENARWHGSAFQPWKHTEGHSKAWHALLHASNRVLLPCITMGGDDLYKLSRGIPFVGTVTWDGEGVVAQKSFAAGHGEGIAQWPGFLCIVIQFLFFLFAAKDGKTHIITFSFGGSFLHTVCFLAAFLSLFIWVAVEELLCAILVLACFLG